MKEICNNSKSDVSGSVISDTQWFYGKESMKSFALTTENQLAGLAYIVNSGISSFSGKTISLCNDISLSGYQNGSGWIPVGNENNGFEGTFDGKGHSISNIHINRLNEDNQGFFGNIINAEVKNLNVDVNDVIGHENVGGLVGYNKGSLIENCNVTINEHVIVSGYENIGGLVGHSVNKTATIRNCSVNICGKVSGYENIGGVIGLNSCGIIENSFAAVNGIVCGGTAGGVAGLSGGKITNCYVSGKISGGVTGSIAGMNCGKITNCTALNNKVTGYSVGRIAGSGKGGLTDNYAWNGMKIGMSDNETASGFPVGNDSKNGADITAAEAMENLNKFWASLNVSKSDITTGGVVCSVSESYPLPYITTLGKSVRSLMMTGVSRNIRHRCRKTRDYV